MRILGIASLLIGLGTLFGLLILDKYHSLQFQRNCSGYLKRAADANSIELAAGELDKALNHIEENGLTTGTTYAWYDTPSCDLEFWYTNLKTARDELKEFPDDADRLTVSNQLLKLRETIVDQKEKGPKVTLPPHIEIYPAQTYYQNMILGALFSLVSGMFLLGGSCHDSSCTTNS